MGRQAAPTPGRLCRLACLCPQQGEPQAPARRVQPHERCTEAPAPVSSPLPRPPTSPRCSPASVPSAWSTRAPWAVWPMAPLAGVRQPVHSWAREQMLPERAAGCWGSPLEPRAPCIPGVPGVDPWLGRSVQWAHCPCQRPRARAPGGLAWPPIKRTRVQHRLGCSPRAHARAVPACACSEAAPLTFQCGGLLLQGIWPGSCKPRAGSSASERWPDCGATWELAGLRDPGETGSQHCGLGAQEEASRPHAGQPLQCLSAPLVTRAGSVPWAAGLLPSIPAAPLVWQHCGSASPRRSGASSLSSSSTSRWGRGRRPRAHLLGRQGCQSPQTHGWARWLLSLCVIGGGPRAAALFLPRALAQPPGPDQQGRS